MAMTFNPGETRLAPGTFNKDMKAPRGKKGQTKEGLHPAPMDEHNKNFGKSGSMMHDYSLSKNVKHSNFITDADMDLKKNHGKSGKY